MAHIELQNVTVEFPVFNINARSLKKQFLRLSTGGQVSRDANKHVVVKSLNNINLTLHHGDRVGLIGHNGAGKSTLLKLLAQIYEPTHGSMSIHGKISPMLNLMQGIEAEFTGYENIVQRGILFGLTRKEIQLRFDEIAELTGLGDYLSMPVITYSSGMMVRLAFAIATSINPDILLADEVFGAADAAFLNTATSKMKSLLKHSSIVVMASHSVELLEEFCTKAILLDGGELKFYGPIQEAIDIYKGKTS